MQEGMDTADMAETKQFRGGAIALALVALCAIGGLYILYVGTFLVHAYNFFSRHWKPSDKPSDKK